MTTNEDHLADPMLWIEKNKASVSHNREARRWTISAPVTQECTITMEGLLLDVVLESFRWALNAAKAHYRVSK